MKEIGSLRTALAGMAGMAVAMGFGRFVYTPILPGMMEGLALTPADAGLIAAANFLGYLVGAVAAGASWLASRERPALVTAMIGTAVLAATMAISNHVGILLAVRFLAGVASAFALVLLSGIVLAQLAGRGRAELAALHFGGVGFGIAVSSLLILALNRYDIGWRGDWLWTAGLALLCAVGALILLGPSGPADRAAVAEPRLPGTSHLRHLILSYGLFGFGYVVTATFVVAIARDAGVSRDGEVGVWLIAGVAAAPSVWLWDRLAKRIGDLTTLAIACGVESLGVGASVLFGGIAGPLIGALLVGGTFVAATALGLRAARRMAPDAPRRAIAAMTAAFGVGQICGPLVAGLLAQAAGNYRLASLMAAAALLLSAVLALRSRSPGQP